MMLSISELLSERRPTSSTEASNAAMVAQKLEIVARISKNGSTSSGFQRMRLELIAKTSQDSHLKAQVMFQAIGNSHGKEQQSVDQSAT